MSEEVSKPAYDEAERPGDYIKFLGTAGARFAVAKQIRSSAGAYLELKGKRILFDMGPGTLVRLAQTEPPIDVFTLDALILTHSHIDHSSDVNCLIDAVTAGGIWNRGVLFTPEGCLEGENRVVLQYLRSFLEDIVVLKEKQEYNLGDLKFHTTIRHHHGVETYGLRFDLEDLNLSFLIDTRFFPQLIESYIGSDVLVINMVRKSPEDAPHALHLCIDDVIEIIRQVQPRKTILTHFGMRVIQAGPDEVAQRAADATGLEVIAAEDDMVVNLASTKEQVSGAVRSRHDMIVDLPQGQTRA